MVGHAGQPADKASATNGNSQTEGLVVGILPSANEGREHRAATTTASGFRSV